ENRVPARSRLCSGQSALFAVFLRCARPGATPRTTAMTTAMAGNRNNRVRFITTTSQMAWTWTGLILYPIDARDRMRGVTFTAGTSGPTLVRDLRRTDLVALTVNNVIGAGVFTMSAALAAGAGRASLAVLLLTILLASMMALCLAEVASRFDRTGGPMVYASEAFGRNAGFVVGWLMYLSRLSAFGAIAVVMLDYGAGLWPVLASMSVRLAAVTLLIAALAATNLRGVSL